MRGIGSRGITAADVDSTQRKVLLKVVVSTGGYGCGNYYERQAGFADGGYLCEEEGDDGFGWPLLLRYVAHRN